MLESRASALKVRDFKKAKEVEVEMTKFKNDNLDELMRP